MFASISWTLPYTLRNGPSISTPPSRPPLPLDPVKIAWALLVLFLLFVGLVLGVGGVWLCGGWLLFGFVFVLGSNPLAGYVHYDSLIPPPLALIVPSLPRLESAFPSMKV